MFDHKSHTWLRRAFVHAGRGSRPRVALRLDCLEDRSTPTVIALTAVADNTLYEHDTGQLSNGAGQHLYVGKTGPLAGNKVRARSSSSTWRRFRPDRPLPRPAHPARLATEQRAQDRRIAPSAKQLGRRDLQCRTGAEGDGTAPTTGDATWIHRFNTQTGPRRWRLRGGRERFADDQCSR